MGWCLLVHNMYTGGWGRSEWVTEQEWCGTVGARREGRAPEEQSVGGEIDSADDNTSQ